MPKVVYHFADPIDPAAPLAAAPARCLRCGIDLTHLPELARYCPRCGLDTLSSPPAAIERRQGLDDYPSEWLHLRQLVGTEDEPIVLPSFAFTEQRSLMLRGYANAMYSLGRRYETGRGAAHIPGEAARCYIKAARLGNPWALGRLAARWLGRAGRLI